MIFWVAGARLPRRHWGRLNLDRCLVQSPTHSAPALEMKSESRGLDAHSIVALLQRRVSG